MRKAGLIGDYSVGIPGVDVVILKKFKGKSKSWYLVKDKYGNIEEVESKLIDWRE
jgi:hypothetical protein